jgi:hypothetical protein
VFYNIQSDTSQKKKIFLKIYFSAVIGYFEFIMDFYEPNMAVQLSKHFPFLPFINGTHSQTSIKM